MKAMLLAAGFGKRLRPLTLSTPKPLLPVADRPLIFYQIENLIAAGVTELVVNLHYLGDQIEQAIVKADFDIDVTFSRESVILETGGGIKSALPLLGQQPFICVSADTYIDYDFTQLPDTLPSGCLGAMLMTANPQHHPVGDFVLDDAGWLHLADGRPTLTYTGVAVFSPALVSAVSAAAFPLREVFDTTIGAGQMMGLRHQGYWCDVGTPDRLAALRAHVENPG